MNEISINVTLEFDPDLTKFVKRVRGNYTDIETKEPIPKGSSAYKITFRNDGHMYPAYVLPVTYQKLIAENQ